MGLGTMAAQPQTAQESFAAGNESLRRGAWQDARGSFETALGCGESAEAWEGLGWAGWWLHDAELTMRARERAYRAFRAAGDPAAPARVAAWLASDFLEFRGEDAVGARLARARPPHARRAARARGPRLAGAQRGLVSR